MDDHTPDLPPGLVEDPEQRGATPPATSPAMQLRRGEFRYEDSADPDFVEPANPQAMLSAVVKCYFKDQPEVFVEASARYERMRARDSELVPAEPRATVVIPVALHNEKVEAVRNTLAQLASQEGAEQDEVLLYGNMPTSLSEAEKETARLNFDTLIAEAREKYPDVHFRSVAEEYDWDEDVGVFMGKIRHDYMDVVALDADVRGFRVDHPVVMLDADTRQLSETAVGQLAQTLTAPDSSKMVAHLETQYLFDEDGGVNEDGSVSDARKLATVQEIRRRQWQRTVYRETLQGNRARLGENHDLNKSYYMNYDEEWGAAVSLGACLIAGNYNEQGKLHESRHLRSRKVITVREITRLMQYAKPAIKGRMEYRSYYLVGQHIRGSGRRVEAFLRGVIAAGDEDAARRESLLPDLIEQNVPYEDFSHTDKVRGDVGAEPSFHDQDQAQRLVNGITQPDTVQPGDDIVALPDSNSLLRRYGLPEVTKKDGNP